jgi:hypothetical protein
MDKEEFPYLVAAADLLQKSCLIIHRGLLQNYHSSKEKLETTVINVALENNRGRQDFGMT